MAHAGETSHKHTNRLAQESSPYLLQHAHNPVDWHPWGPEAFEKARREGKPIFLSVGYSTCYWCHVMERQSFENETIAAEMNRLLVNIKVDREERPDVDQLYMTAVQVQTRQGGWPMSVFLTPDLRYFYGGTYFPPTDAYGRPGFLSLIRAISDAYQNRRKDIEETADQFVEILSRSTEPAQPRSRVIVDQDLVARLIAASASDYDSQNGGFGGAPKFPRETLLELLLAATGSDVARSGSEISDSKSEISNLRSGISNSAFAISNFKSLSNLKSQLLHTLDAMAGGGIRDQLGGGFHRYSTDAQWLVPHFEIMLYDNAMLGWCYAEAFAQTGERRYANIARGIFDFILREMTSPDGAFYTAFDAEVDAQEGLSYLWTADEIEASLGQDDAKLFNRVYGVDAGPNFADPHHGGGAPDKNILFLPQPMAEVAAELKTDADSLDARLAPMRQKLYQLRLKRKQPLLDTKIITSWNALMIRGLAHGGNVLQEPRYTQAAVRAAEFLLSAHRTPGGGIYRTSREGNPRYDGFLDDYAFLAQALLSLESVTADAAWKSRAMEIATLMQQKFEDSDKGGFFFTEAGAPDMIVRQKTATDSPLPSGSAVAAMVLTELGINEPARRTLSLYAEQMQDYGEGMSSMVLAAMQFIRRFGAFETGPGDATASIGTQSLQETAINAVSVKSEWRDALQLIVTLEIQEPFHLNAHNVANSTASLLPTTLTASGAGSTAKVEYPPGELRRFAYSDEPLRVYEGTIEILLKFPATRLTEPFGMTIKYQPCTEDACLLPVTKHLTVKP